MSEIFDIIIAVNRLKDEVKELKFRIDEICKNPSIIASDKVVNEKTACRLLHVSPSKILRMRNKGEITFIRSHRTILYPMASIQDYLNDKTIQSKLAS